MKKQKRLVTNIRHQQPPIRSRLGLLGILALMLMVRVASAQPSPESESIDEPPENAAPTVPDKVDVDPLANDDDIATRLTRILDATEWFANPTVEVDEGVVFMRGRVDTEQHREWAGRLAGNTQDVVAVVNRIEIVEKSMWDLSPAWKEVQQLGADTVRNSPLIFVGLLLFVITGFATQWSVRGASAFLSTKLKSQLLRSVVARAVGIPVFLLGLYLVLKVSGLTRLAMTVVGGTGLLGLVIGFAFRDIAENFLASILISIQHPFASGDLIEVAGYKGYVQSVNTRSTLLMTLDGNHVQIPNATIYKETITNFTANPNARFDFAVGIGYDDSIAQAQSVALSVLHNHQAVVDEPEPLVLVEALGASTVNLRVYFWVDIDRYSFLKVTSAVIRQTKQAFEDAGISMPDESREVVFPSGVPVRMLSDKEVEPDSPSKSPSSVVDNEPANSAEGNLASEAQDINHQAQMSRSPESAQNLLQS